MGDDEAKAEDKEGERFDELPPSQPRKGTGTDDQVNKLGQYLMGNSEDCGFDLGGVSEDFLTDPCTAAILVYLRTIRTQLSANVLSAKMFS